MNFRTSNNQSNKQSMNNPNPLVPQGSLLEQKAKGKSNLFIAVFSILAIHVVLFAGLLMQGCGRKKPSEADAAKMEQTNSVASDTNYVSALTNTLPPPTTNATFYTEQPTNFAATPVNPIAAAPTNQLDSAPPPDETAAGGAAKEYKVAKGDMFYTIAKAHGISISALKAANPTVDPNRLRVGAILQIPASSATATAATGAKNRTDAGAASGSDAKTYIVKAGDTLTKIAKVNGASVKEVRSFNGLKTDRLHVGQKLKIPAKSHAASTTASHTGTN